MPETRTGLILPEIAGASPFILLISDTSMRVLQVSDRHKYMAISPCAYRLFSRTCPGVIAEEERFGDGVKHPERLNVAGSTLKEAKNTCFYTSKKDIG